MYPVLRPGMSDANLVPKLRHFLVGLDCAPSATELDCDPSKEDCGEFRWGAFTPDDMDEPNYGPKTVIAIKCFQNENMLDVDGIIGEKTWEALKAYGFPPEEDVGDEPLHPRPLTNDKEHNKVFGKIEYVASPTPKNPEHITITNDWAKNVIWVNLPQLQMVLPKVKGMKWHKNGANQLKALFWLWAYYGIVSDIIDYQGSWVCRYVRGSKKNLSSHSWASAFDINVQYNKRGAVPAALNKKGCVRRLAAVCAHLGFFWGGWYKGKLDGMHFELFKLMTKEEIYATLDKLCVPRDGLNLL